MNYERGRPSMIFEYSLTYTDIEVKKIIKIYLGALLAVYCILGLT